MKKYFNLALSIIFFVFGIYVYVYEVITVGDEALGKEGYRVLKRYFGDFFPGGEGILYFIFSYCLFLISVALVGSLFLAFLCVLPYNKKIAHTSNWYELD